MNFVVFDCIIELKYLIFLFFFLLEFFVIMVKSVKVYVVVVNMFLLLECDVKGYFVFWIVWVRNI